MATDRLVTPVREWGLPVPTNAASEYFDLYSFCINPRETRLNPLHYGEMAGSISPPGKWREKISAESDSVIRVGESDSERFDEFVNYTKQDASKFEGTPTCPPGATSRAWVFIIAWCCATIWMSHVLPQL
jgi:hypothetical protein